MNTKDKIIRDYLSKIGRKGGQSGRRNLDAKTARQMAMVREAKRAFKKYHAQCFWSYNPRYKISIADIRWVGEELMKNGDLKLWQLGVKLCH